jgi:hypothetical protein
MKYIPKNKPTMKKYYFNTVTSNGPSKDFQRLAFQLLTDSSVMLIQYIGDSSVAEDFPHGNSHTTKPYIRVCPSVIKEIKAADMSEPPSKIYKREVSTFNYPAQLSAVLQPSSTRQVTNHKSIERQRFRLSHDGLYNLHEISYDLCGFVSKIITYPDLIVVCGLPSILNELKYLLSMPLSSSSSMYQLLSYDTTFQLGDFYVSALLFRHSLFVAAPVIPACFLIHERKLQAAHDEMMKFISLQIPRLCNCGSNSIPIVTDEEKAICSAIDCFLPGAVRIRCWNHTISSAKYWLRKHGANSTEIPVYIADIRSLLQSESEIDYLDNLSMLKDKWSNPFTEYFMTEIHPDIPSSLGRWVLEQLNIYTPYSGVTTNQSEGFNSVLKRLLQWKEAPVDSFVLSLYHLQVYYYNEIKRGLCQIGNFQLCPEFAHIARSSDEAEVIPCRSPEDIVVAIHSGMLPNEDDVNV